MDAAERRRSSVSSSPEFEFWPVHANSAASPSCADELFADGLILPLPVLPHKIARRHDEDNCCAAPEDPDRAEAACPGASTVGAVLLSAVITSPAAPPGGSKRWTDMFARKPAEDKAEKRKDGAAPRKPPAPTGGSELNINIWPFSRSRSAGGGGSSNSKPRAAPRKISSAPCSRSNSRGDTVGRESGPSIQHPRRWAASPGRAGGGVPVGRSSPVWQIKRTAPPKPFAADQPADRRAHQKDKGKKAGVGGGGGMRGINLSVNSCIGYRHQVSCRRADAGVTGGRSTGDGGLFGIKGFFSKKVH